ncbi:MAG: DNA starvation/stationary phase protection protein [Bacteroidales bacterium]|nr:DNA starvation/stationary phase protection protein [Bacteroidales bacterium]
MKSQLNVLLADLAVEYHKLQNFHWYVAGPDFFAVHAQLENYYDAINEAIDEVAENMLMIGEKPAASLKEFLEIAKIKEAKAEKISSKEVFSEVLTDFNYLLNSAKLIKKSADSEDLYLISALMDNYIQQFSKNIWMLNQVVK